MTINKMKYSVEDWIQWIEDQLNGVNTDFTELQYSLFNEFNLISQNYDVVNNFTKAVIATLNQIPKINNNSEQIHALITLSEYIKPEKYAQFYEGMLYEGVLKYLTYNENPLEDYLINALIAFTNVDSLDNFFENALYNSEDPKVLLSLRYHYNKSERKHFFKHILDIIEKKYESPLIENYCDDVIFTLNEMATIFNNYNQIFNWWVEVEAEFKYLYPKIFPLLNKLMGNWLDFRKYSINNNHAYILGVVATVNTKDFFNYEIKEKLEIVLNFLQNIASINDITPHAHTLLTEKLTEIFENDFSLFEYFNILEIGFIKNRFHGNLEKAERSYERIHFAILKVDGKAFREKLRQSIYN